MGIGCRPDRVDEEPARAEDAAHLRGEPLDLGRREGHAEEHVRVAGINSPLEQRKRVADVAGKRLDRRAEPGGLGLGGDLGKTRIGVVEGDDAEAGGCEEERVAALARTKLEDLGGIRVDETAERRAARFAGLRPKEVRPYDKCL